MYRRWHQGRLLFSFCHGVGWKTSATMAGQQRTRPSLKTNIQKGQEEKRGARPKPRNQLEREKFVFASNNTTLTVSRRPSTHGQEIGGTERTTIRGDAGNIANIARMNRFFFNENARYCSWVVHPPRASLLAGAVPLHPLRKTQTIGVQNPTRSCWVMAADNEGDSCPRERRRVPARRERVKPCAPCAPRCRHPPVLF